MNSEEIKGRWQQIEGSVKAAWADITDDDLLAAEGSLEKLYGIIHARVGATREAIQKKLDHLLR